MGRRVEVPALPKRIVSLVPSQSELLCDLGLDTEVIGITKFCVHPDHWRKSKTIIGGTKKFRFDVIDSLKPDLIIGNKEENYLDGVSKLEKKYPVWMSDIFNLKDALNMIAAVGQIAGKSKMANSICTQLNQDFSMLPLPKKGKALYLIWKDPYMVAGSNTFIDEMMKIAGFENLISDERYPELNLADMMALEPEFVLLSSEPFPFKEKHIIELKEKLPNAKILLVDGEIFSWYGTRLLKAREYLEKI